LTLTDSERSIRTKPDAPDVTGLTTTVSDPMAEGPVAHAGSAAPSAVGSTVELVIQPKRGWIAIDWSEMLHFRELLYFLVWRDVKVRYKQTILGFAWALLQPLMQALIAVLIFGAAAGFQDYLPGHVPYLLFALAGQIPWQFFQTGLGQGGMSLVNQQHMITKIYFPRLFLPTSVIGGALVDLVISFTMLAVFMVCYHFSHWQFTPPPQVLLLPLLLIPAAIASLGVAYMLSAVTVTYRDFRFLIPVGSQLWMWMSFVMMPRELILRRPRLAHMEWVLALNPMYGIIQGVRHVLLGMDWVPWHLALGTVVACGMCVLGMFYFRKTERRFADIA
jgi:lipopolysaccharide transport system permease protein